MTKPTKQSSCVWDRKSCTDRGSKLRLALVVWGRDSEAGQGVPSETLTGGQGGVRGGWAGTEPHLGSPPSVHPCQLTDTCKNITFRIIRNAVSNHTDGQWPTWTGQYVTLHIPCKILQWFISKLLETAVSFLANAGLPSWSHGFESLDVLAALEFLHDLNRKNSIVARPNVKM